MNIYDSFSSHLKILCQGKGEDLSNLFIQHGIIHLFMEQFDLSQELFRSQLQKDGQFITVVSSPKEVIMAAYEAYLFVDEDIWLSMLRDRHDSVTGDIKVWAQRILDCYIPAFQCLEEAFRPKEG